MTKVTLVGAREELDTSYGPGYLKMSTTPENKKILLHDARENSGNEVGYSLGIMCTSR